MDMELKARFEDLFAKYFPGAELPGLRKKRLR